MPNKKVAIFVTLLIIASACGLILFISQTDIGRSIANELGGPTGFLMGLFSKPTQTVNFQAELSFTATPNLKLSGDESTKVVVEYSNADTVLSIGGLERRSAESTKLELENYKGSINLRGILLDLDGSAIKITSNDDIWVSSEKVGNTTKAISIKATNISFDSVSITDLPKKSLALANVTGTLSWGDEKTAVKGTYNFDNEPLDIESFSGDISMSNEQLKISGSGKIKSTFLLGPNK